MGSKEEPDAELAILLLPVTVVARELLLARTGLVLAGLLLQVLKKAEVYR
jgi:hypothetical protein